MHAAELTGFAEQGTRASTPLLMTIGYHIFVHFINGLSVGLLDALDRQRQTDVAARLVARPLTLGHPARALVETLGRALLQEDAGFHAYEIFEAGVTQIAEWGGDTAQGRHTLIAVARYHAAHAPTERSALQTAEIAHRLMHGAPLHDTAAPTARPNRLAWTRGQFGCLRRWRRARRHRAYQLANTGGDRSVPGSSAQERGGIDPARLGTERPAMARRGLTRRGLARGARLA